MLQKPIIKSALPFLLVEYDEFIELISKGYLSLKLISKPTFMKRISTCYEYLIKNLTTSMESVKYITTTDCWSIFKRLVPII